MESKTSILASTQSLPSKTTKGRLNMYSAGYSSSFAQDADIMIGMRRLGDYAEMDLLALRSGVPTTAYWHVDWKNGSIYEVPASHPAVSSDTGNKESPPT